MKTESHTYLSIKYMAFDQYILGHVLLRIDYKHLQNCLASEHKNIVLMEYVHSPLGATIFSTERIPGTTTSYHSVLYGSILIEIRRILGTPNAYIYTRRKQGTDKRQLVMNVEYLEPIKASEFRFKI